jgi:hypothetical protein
VNPLAHVIAHAPKVSSNRILWLRAAFEKMVATGTSAHHAEHVLAALFLEAHWGTARAVDVIDMDKAEKGYIRKLQKLVQNSAFRKKTTRQFTADHSAFEITDAFPGSTFPMNALPRSA